MKNYQIITGIAGTLVSAILFAGIYAASTIAGARIGNQTEPTCSEQLRQTMDDMHREMHQVQKTGDADEDFMLLMLPHHEGAVEMAKVELKCGKDAVNRRLAQEIIVEQQSEIDLMKLWLAKRASPKNPDQNEHRHEEETKP